MKALFASLLAKPEDEQLVGVDIGMSTIKLMELDMRESQPKLITVSSSQTPSGAINNHVIVRPDQVAAQIRSMINANDIKATKAVISIPGPSAFTKKISMAICPLKELKNTIYFEAANYIPHKIENVYLDYQVLKTNGRSTMEVLLVAVKSEIVKSYIDTIEQAGLEPTIVDVDYFALGNMFTLNYPEDQGRTLALVNVGSRFTSVNIVQDGNSLFVGDISVGGKFYTDALVDRFGMDPHDAEACKVGRIPERFDAEAVAETLVGATDHVAGELHRQIGFFWNAAATDKSIEEICFTGGAAQIPGLIDAVNARVGINCRLVDTLRNVACSEEIDREYLGELAPSMGVSVGLAIRRMGDKTHAVS